MGSLSISKRGLAIVACFAAVFLWGGSFVAIKMALGSFEPLLIIFLRTFIGFFVIFPSLLITEGLTIPSRKELPILILFGLIGVGFYQWLQAVGVRLTSASQTSWLTASAPVFMVLMGWLFLKEKVQVWQIIGLCMALGGGFLVASGDGGIAMSFSNLSGPMVVFAGALVWAGYSVLGKHLVKDIHPLKLTFYSMLIGWVFLIPIITITGGWKFPKHISIEEWLAVVFLGVGSTGLAYAFYFFALKGVEITMVAVIQYLEPLITVLLASWLIAERMTYGGFVGGLLILLGVWLVNRFAPVKD
jgi:drug/metabolite transporter (DMT)-like permease